MLHIYDLVRLCPVLHKSYVARMNIRNNAFVPEFFFLGLLVQTACKTEY